MKTFNLLTALGVIATLSPLTFGQLNLVTTRGDFAATDTVNWTVLGGPFTIVNSPFTIATTGGSTVAVAHNVAPTGNPPFERRNQGPGGGWNSGNFSSGDALLWNRGNNGAVTFDPANLISGAGFNVQSDAYGAFVFKLEAYGLGGNLLGTVTEAGYADNSVGAAIFIGFTSTSANIDKFVATLVQSQAPSGDSNFAINTLALSGPSEAAPAVVPVPEPSVYGMMGAFVVLGLVARERLRRHAEA